MCLIFAIVAVWLVIEVALKFLLWIPYILPGFIHALLKHK